MRAIILIQSIIIVLGAYYIYTMTHAVTTQSAPAPTPVLDMTPTSTPADVHPGYVPPTTQPPKDISATTSEMNSPTGPNDSGMEYPVNPDSNYPDQPLRPE